MVGMGVYKSCQGFFIALIFDSFKGGDDKFKIAINFIVTFFQISIFFPQCKSSQHSRDYEFI